MHTYLQTPTYRYLLIGGALITYISIVVSGSPLLTLTATACIGACGLAMLAGQRQDGDMLDPWVRRPPLFALGLLAAQALLSGLVIWLELPNLTMLVQPGLTTLTLACLIVPAIALSIPNSAGVEQLGGRASKQARRYRRLVFAATLITWLLIPLGVIGADSDVVRVLYHGNIAAASLIILLVLWQTWRSRRGDRLVLSTATLAAGLQLLQLSIEAGHMFRVLPPSSYTLHLALTVGLWSVLVALSILALRRPAPAIADAAPIGNEAAAIAAKAAAKQPSLLADYITLTKPRVISLLLVTTLAAMFITGEGLPSFALVCWTMLGGYLAAGGAGAINMAMEGDIDILMGRTGKRPVPSGRISPRRAFWFGVVLGVLSFVVLAVFTTWLAAVLAMVGLFYYTVIYTRWLKRATWHNIVIGGGAGAIPPLVGWAAVTGSLNLSAVILFLIIFYWTPPHFWALALVREKDYARAGVPMLPVVAGEQETRWQIWLYSLLMFFITLLLTPLGAMGWIYLALAIILGAVFLRYAWNVWRAGGQSNIWGLYKYSLLYLALLFGAMVLDRMLLA